MAIKKLVESYKAGRQIIAELKEEDMPMVYCSIPSIYFNEYSNSPEFQ